MYQVPWHALQRDHIIWSFPSSSDGKESACSIGDLVQSLGQEDALEKGMVTRSSILA